MSNKIGRFEILSEIARSGATSVYKASDTETGQTVALKTLNLEILGDQARNVMEQVLEEADASKVLNSPNIAMLFGVGDIEQLLCASMEYVQGNSIATILTRKEGFSIWDIQDVARQTCQGLDHAHAKGVFHYSMEPAKIMVQWDGTVKTLCFGTSKMTAFAAQAGGVTPQVLHYMSPEQLRGDPLDARSNIFSLGAILYEMVTEHRAFPGETGEQVRQNILEGVPAAPVQVNRKIHPVLNEVIVKALAKDPGQRYQCGQELINDLERCKESAIKSAAQPAQGLTAPEKVKPASVVAAGAAATVSTADHKTAVKQTAPPPAPKAAAAAAAAGAGGGKTASAISASMPVRTTAEPASAPSPKMSAATAEPEVETPRFSVDPMMDESAAASASRGRSFSELEELPPLKEVRIAPQPAPDPQAEIPVRARTAAAAPEKLQPREAAKKAVAEIKKTPPKLFGYAIAAALAVILLIVAAIAWHIHSENADDSSASTPDSSQAQGKSAPQAQTQQVTPPAEIAAAEQAVEAPEVTPVVSEKRPFAKKKSSKAPAPVAPAIVPGQLTVNSTPEGAQVQIDGRSDPAWVTPFNLGGVAPGQHTATISRPGYVSQTRNIDVSSGSKSFLAVQLAALTAMLSVTSEPVGAVVLLDGKDTGHLTPAQIAVDKPGNHTVEVRRQGYLEENTTVNLQLGQSTHYAATLRPLGSTDEIKTVSKFKKMFHGDDSAGMGTVSVKTNPKGAQVAINQRIVDKMSPVEFYLNPGNYIIDISLSGFKTVHKVITVDKSGKVAIDETLQPE